MVDCLVDRHAQRVQLFLLGAVLRRLRPLELDSADLVSEFLLVAAQRRVQLVARSAHVRLRRQI